MQAKIAQFKAHLEQRYPGRSTTKHYMNDLAIFSANMADTRAQNITIKDIDHFVETQSQQGLKAATINRRLSAISSFFEYLMATNDDDDLQNPVHWKRHGIRPGRHLPRDVSDSTVTALLDVIQNPRDRAMVMLMIGAGLRIGEVVNLQLADLDSNATSPLVRLRVRGKGDKERVVWITQDVFHNIQAWLEKRPETKHQSVFLNQHQRPLSVSGVQFRLKQHCQKAGVQLSAHQLRHTYARRLVEHQMPVESLAKLLGHADLKTTQRYIDGADPALRTDFLQAMQNVDQAHDQPEPQKAHSMPKPAAVTPEEKRPAPVALLEKMGHLDEDLPDWLVALLRQHLLRCSSRWAAHRVEPNLRNYLGQTHHLCRWLIENRNWRQIDQLHRSDLAAYVNARQAEGVKPNTIRTELTTFRSLWREWLAEELVTNRTLLQVKGPAVGDPLPRYLTLAEYQRLEQVVQNETAQDGPQDRLHRAWFYLLAHTGVRSSELFNLRVDDCDLAAGRLRVCSGKGNRDRTIPLTSQLATILQAYLAVREPASSNHLLIERKMPLDRNVVVRKLRMWGQQVGISPLTPHRLRHTLATLLINQGMPVTSLQKLLGHQHIGNTMIYARVHDETVKQQFSAAMHQIEGIPALDWPIQVVKSIANSEHTFELSVMRAHSYKTSPKSPNLPLS